VFSSSGRQSDGRKTHLEALPGTSSIEQNFDTWEASLRSCRARWPRLTPMRSESRPRLMWVTLETSEAAARLSNACRVTGAASDFEREDARVDRSAGLKGQRVAAGGSDCDPPDV
jgi:hypothetical protein